MERKTHFFLFFFALKARAAMLFTAETSEVLEIKNSTSAITYSSPDGLTLWFPSLTSKECPDVVTKFFRMGR